MLDYFSVLLKDVPDSATINLLYKTIDSISTEREDDIFYINSNLILPDKDDLRPFGMDMIEINSENSSYSEIELGCIKAKFHFYPKFEISLAPMCNDLIDIDLRNLLTLKIAEELDGIINVGSYAETIKNIKGEICTVEYEAAAGNMNQYYVIDVESMRNLINKAKVTY